MDKAKQIELREAVNRELRGRPAMCSGVAHDAVLRTVTVTVATAGIECSWTVDDKEPIAEIARQAADKAYQRGRELRRGGIATYETGQLIDELTIRTGKGGPAAEILAVLSDELKESGILKMDRQATRDAIQAADQMREDGGL